MRVTCLTRYGRLGASSRLRFLQYAGPLRRVAPDLHFAQQGLLDSSYLLRKYAGRATLLATLRCYGQRALCGELWTAPDVWWIEKELWPWAPAWLERRLLRRRPYVLDFDDATFHTYDMHRHAAIRRLYGRKIDRLMASATLVTAGNEYLARRAREAGAHWVEILPTVVDLDRYPRPQFGVLHTSAPLTRSLTIGWIGSPTTVGYLEQLAEPLRQLGKDHRVRLHVIGGGDVRMQGVEVVPIPWSEDTEVASIAQCDIGVMPLRDSLWERGKCGYKLIQYMACGLPVIASPVGANTSIVTEGSNGFLPSHPAEWYSALRRLAVDAPLRARLGAAGRARVESEFCVQVTAPRLAHWLRTLCKSSA